MKHRKCNELNIKSEVVHFNEDVDEIELINKNINLA